MAVKVGSSLPAPAWWCCRQAGTLVWRKGRSSMGPRHEVLAACTWHPVWGIQGTRSLEVLSPTGGDLLAVWVPRQDARYWCGAVSMALRQEVPATCTQHPVWEVHGTRSLEVGPPAGGDLLAGWGPWQEARCWCGVLSVAPWREVSATGPQHTCREYTIQGALKYVPRQEETCWLVKRDSTASGSLSKVVTALVFCSTEAWSGGRVGG